MQWWPGEGACGRCPLSQTRGTEVRLGGTGMAWWFEFCYFNAIMLINFNYLWEMGKCEQFRTPCHNRESFSLDERKSLGEGSTQETGNVQKDF